MFRETARPLSARVLYVWDADYPWDVRTEKICRALTDAGHSVAIAARNGGWLPEQERLPEGEVRRLRPWKWMGRRGDRLSSFPAFVNPRWIGHLLRTARSTVADLLLVRDLPLAPTAIWVGASLGIPVVLDMAENYPAMIQDVWTAGRNKPLDVLVRNPRVISRVERFVLPRVDHVLTVVEESSQRLITLGLPPDRVTVVSNTPPAARAGASTGRIRTADPLALVYLGLMEVPRGILEVLEATAALLRKGHSLTLTLVGDGRDLELFRSRAAALALPSATVRFLGRVPNHEALRIVAEADVGLVPHHANESWNTTIPNKLFDYMAAGLPVVTSDAVPAARVVRETGAGVIFQSGDAESLADAIRALLDPSARDAYAAAGQKAVRDQFNWERDTARLLDVVTRVARTGADS